MADEAPVCAECKSFIEGNKAVRVNKRYYHVEHFCCTQCKRSVAQEEYVELDDTGSKRACDACFAKMRGAKRCEKCQELIFGDFVSTKHPVSGVDHHYHTKCFTCSKCNAQLNDKYGAIGGRVVCGNCKLKSENRRCDTCNQPIEGDAKNAQNKWYHPHHFYCTVCKEVLDNDYAEESGQIYCKKHYAEKTQAKCAACDKGIFPRDLFEAEGKKWHMSCFNCLQCKTNLALKNYGTWAGKPFCPDCYKKL